MNLSGVNLLYMTSTANFFNSTYIPMLLFLSLQIKKSILDGEITRKELSLLNILIRIPTHIFDLILT